MRVHGHGQCAHCGSNIEPCCSGANALDEAGVTSAVDIEPGRQLFPRLFEQLGGQAATVTSDALLFALAQRLATDLDEARIVLEAAERLGIVQRVGAHAHRLQRASA